MVDTARRDRILGLTDLAHGPGLEIAPLHSPIALKADWDVRYVDVLSTEQLLAHYGPDPGVPDEDVVPVDFALTGPDGVIRPLTEVAGTDAPYEWVIASHVIEHVPDLITWLQDIAELLGDGGALVLAIPDTRYTFDAYRPQTTVGQMLQAHHQGDLAPSVRAVYDHFRSASTVSTALARAGTLPPIESTRSHDLGAVLAMLERCKAGHYVDSHVWTFRPSTFIQQVNELGELGLCDFVVETVRNTTATRQEFYAVLRRLPRDRSAEQDIALRAAGKHRTNDEPRRPPVEPDPSTMRLSAQEQRLIRRKRAALLAARRLLRRPT